MPHAQSHNGKTTTLATIITLTCGFLKAITMIIMTLVIHHAEKKNNNNNSSSTDIRMFDGSTSRTNQEKFPRFEEK